MGLHASLTVTVDMIFEEFANAQKLQNNDITFEQISKRFMQWYRSNKNDSTPQKNTNAPNNGSCCIFQKINILRLFYDSNQPTVEGCFQLAT